MITLRSNIEALEEQNKDLNQDKSEENFEIKGGFKEFL